MGVPCVNIGSRQDGRERNENVIDVDYDRKAISEAVVGQMDNGHYEPSFLYGDGKAGERIVEILRDFKFRIQKRIAY